nr:uncharacterized protein LOC109182900 [Ipomoea batatas]
MLRLLSRYTFSESRVTNASGPRRISCKVPSPSPTRRSSPTVGQGYDWIYTAVVVNCTFSDEEFSKKIQELVLRFQLSGDEYEDSDKEELVGDSRQAQYESNGSMFLENQKVFDPVKPPDWVEREEIIPAASIKWKANSVDLPISLRIIKRKKQWAEGFHEEGELASCSMKRAFSNMFGDSSANLFMSPAANPYKSYDRLGLGLGDGSCSKSRKKLGGSPPNVKDQNMDQTTLTKGSGVRLGVPGNSAASAEQRDAEEMGWSLSFFNLHLRVLLSIRASAVAVVSGDGDGSTAGVRRRRASGGVTVEDNGRRRALALQRQWLQPAPLGAASGGRRSTSWQTAVGACCWLSLLFVVSFGRRCFSHLQMSLWAAADQRWAFRWHRDEDGGGVTLFPSSGGLLLPFFIGASFFGIALIFQRSYGRKRMIAADDCGDFIKRCMWLHGCCTFLYTLHFNYSVNEEDRGVLAFTPPFAMDVFLLG